jgi:Ca2+-dependent lipid-binding protein
LQDLPDTDNACFNVSRRDTTDPYVELSIGSTSLLKTTVERNSLHPYWNEKFLVFVCHNAAHILVQVGWPGNMCKKL